MCCSKFCMTYARHVSIASIFVFVNYYPSMNLRHGNVFSHVSVSQVILSTKEEGGAHVTITRDALDFTTQGPFLALPPPPPPPKRWDPTVHKLPWTWHLTVQRPLPSGPSPSLPLLVKSGGQDWRPLQTCSSEKLPANNIWWPRLKICSTLLSTWLVLTSGGYWSTYSWKVGIKHPTVMFSCFECQSQFHKISILSI